MRCLPLAGSLPALAQQNCTTNTDALATQRPANGATYTSNTDVLGYHITGQNANGQSVNCTVSAPDILGNTHTTCN